MDEDGVWWEGGEEDGGWCLVAVAVAVVYLQREK